MNHPYFHGGNFGGCHHPATLAGGMRLELRSRASALIVVADGFLQNGYFMQDSDGKPIM